MGLEARRHDATDAATASAPPNYANQFPTNAIAVGDWVSLSTAVQTNGLASHVTKGTTSPTEGTFYGVALTEASGASTVDPIVVVIKGIVSAKLESDVAKGNVLVPSRSTAGRLAPKPADITAIVTGAAANTNITVTGAKVAAHKVALVYNITDGTIHTTLATVTADDTIQISNTTATDSLLVILTSDAPVARALEDDISNVGRVALFGTWSPVE